jgi:hypothetical protein
MLSTCRNTIPRYVTKHWEGAIFLRLVNSSEAACSLVPSPYAAAKRLTPACLGLQGATTNTCNRQQQAMVPSAAASAPDVATAAATAAAMDAPAAATPAAYAAAAVTHTADLPPTVYPPATTVQRWSGSAATHCNCTRRCLQSSAEQHVVVLFQRCADQSSVIIHNVLRLRQQHHYQLCCN